MAEVTERIGPEAEAKDKPDSTDKRYNSMSPAWELVRDVDGGQRRIQAASTKYLPRHASELAVNYAVRLQRPCFFNAFTRTVDGLTGLVFRRDPVLGQDVPPAIKEHWEDIDLAGTHGDVFCKQVLRDSMVSGHAAIFVDYAPNAAETLADEIELGLRPYWRHIRAENILRVKKEFVHGRTVLKQVTIKETTLEDDGRFGEKAQTHYRIFTRGWVKDEAGDPKQTVMWELWATGERDEYERIDVGYLSLPEIPLVPIYGRQMGVFLSKPPLEDLAHLNTLHYQTNSDYHHSAHMACVPVPVVRGVSEERLEIGPNTSLLLPDSPNAQAYYMETSGAALGHVRQMLQDQESRMASLGLNLLAREKRVAETAKSRGIEKAESDSMLGLSARSLQDGLEQALKYHAMYMGLKDGGSVTVNRDYQALVIEPAQIKALTELTANGQLSLETLWAALKQGNALPDGWDPETEADKIAGDVATIGGITERYEPAA